MSVVLCWIPSICWVSLMFKDPMVLQLWWSTNCWWIFPCLSGRRKRNRGLPQINWSQKTFSLWTWQLFICFFFCVYTTCSTHGNIPWIKWLYAFISQSLWDLYKHKTINHSSNIPYLTCSTTSNWFPPKKILVRLDHHPISRAARTIHLAPTMAHHHLHSIYPLHSTTLHSKYMETMMSRCYPHDKHIYIYTYVHIYYIPMISPCNHHHMESISIARPWPDRPLLVPGWQHLDLTFGHSIPRLPSVQFRRLFCDSCRVL
jgi:hypothetical protein